MDGAVARSRPTMKDVAALSGVSIKTVSRVVNDERGVSPDLVERVNDAARKLDYQRNLTASSLRRGDGRTQTIGLLLENVANPFSSALHRAVEDVAREHGVIVFAGSVDEDPQMERALAAAFVARRVDGLVVVPTGSDQSYLAKERENGTPVVFVDRPPAQLDADWIVTDNLGGADQAVSHLLAHGHRRIAYLGDLATIRTAVERNHGYERALARAGIGADPGLIRENLRTSDDAHAAVTDLLRMPDAPTAIFASQNLVTIGALRALRAAGLQRDIALVGFDALPLVDLIDPGVTLMVQDVVGLGRRAASLLFARAGGDTGPMQHQVLPPTLNVAGTGEIPGPYAR
jgi:LacI family transcriptional regulator